MRIAIIDSGIGGLTVTKAIRAVLPLESYIYCSDNAHFPYGEKTAGEVTQFTLETADKVVKFFLPDLLVVACSTASTVALEPLRQRFKFPIVGVVPAIKPAAEISQSKVIGLLATKGTINRSYTDELIEKFAPHCKVVKLGSFKLVEMAENKMAGETIDWEALKKEVGEFLETPFLDTVILGCTHFPVLKEELEKIAHKKIHWLEPGEAIARRVLEVAKPFSRNTQLGESFFCYTRESEKISKVAPRMESLFGFSRSVLISK